MVKTAQKPSLNLAKPRRVHWRNRWVALEDCRVYEPEFPEMIYRTRGEVWTAQTKHTCPDRAEQSAKDSMREVLDSGKSIKIVYIDTVMFDGE